MIPRSSEYYSMCDLIKVSTIRILAVVERLYAAPILSGARRDLALEIANVPLVWPYSVYRPENSVSVKYVLQ
jgi:hypothetical protein